MPETTDRTPDSAPMRLVPLFLILVLVWIVMAWNFGKNSKHDAEDRSTIRITWPAGVVPSDVSRTCTGENASSNINFVVNAKTGGPTYSDVVLFPGCHISYTVAGVQTSFGQAPQTE